MELIYALYLVSPSNHESMHSYSDATWQTVHSHSTVIIGLNKMLPLKYADIITDACGPTRKITYILDGIL